MQKVNIQPFYFIGISIRTINENGQAAQDIPMLWDRFMKEGVAEKIPNRIDQEMLSLYTNYDGDHTMPYDTVIGCRTSSIDNIPEGMVGFKFEGGAYQKYSGKGDLMQGLVIKMWHSIWEQSLNRKYTADFEVYGAKAQYPNDAEVDIYVAI